MKAPRVQLSVVLSVVQLVAPGASWRTPVVLLSWKWHFRICCRIAEMASQTQSLMWQSWKGQARGAPRTVELIAVRMWLLHLEYAQSHPG